MLEKSPFEPRRPAPPPREAPAARDVTEVVYGLRAALAVFARRPDEVTRVAFSAEVRPELHELLRVCAARKIPCEELTPSRIAESTHHEGLCVSTRPRKWTPAAALADLLTQRRGVAVALGG